MLRSDYKYSREQSTESGATRGNAIGGQGICGNLLTAPGVVHSDPADNSSGDSGGGGSKRSGSMKHWSPFAALGKRARDGLRRCNTVRVGLGGTSAGSMASTSSTAADINLGNRRNAMPNIFLGLPSSGVRRLFAIYGIDDTRGGGGRESSTSTAPMLLSPTTSMTSSVSSAAAGSGKCEESLFARHSRTNSVRSRRPPSIAGPMQQQQYQHMLMVQQQSHLLLPPGGYGQPPACQQFSGPGSSLDRRRAASMRDHQGRQHRAASSSCYGNW